MANEQKQVLVSALMIPLEEYSTVTEKASVYDAVVALEKAQAEYNKKDAGKYRHRAILVVNDKGHVVGKVSQLDIIRALEPKYDQIGVTKSISRFGFTRAFTKNLFEQFSLWDKPLKDICLITGNKNVTEIMHKPDEGEFIDQNAPMAEAVHLLVVGHHQSLLVTNEKKHIVGILRLTDLFHETCQVIKHVIEKEKTAQK